MRLFALFAVVASLSFGGPRDSEAVPDGWKAVSQREEIRPLLKYSASGGRSGSSVLAISTDARDGLDGAWQKTFPVEGGKWYHFSVYRRTSGTEFPQQTGAVTVQWYDAAEKRAKDDRKLVERYLTKYDSPTPLEYPVDMATGSDGWTLVSGLWEAPSTARTATVELHGRWAAKARFEYSQPEFVVADAPKPRLVRLATVHYKPEAG